MTDEEKLNEAANRVMHVLWEHVTDSDVWALDLIDRVQALVEKSRVALQNELPENWEEELKELEDK